MCGKVRWKTKMTRGVRTVANAWEEYHLDDYHSSDKGGKIASNNDDRHQPPTYTAIVPSPGTTTYPRYEQKERRDEHRGRRRFCTVARMKETKDSGVMNRKRERAVENYTLPPRSFQRLIKSIVNVSGVNQDRG